MAPRGRPSKARTSRMDAAIDAMKPYGFAEEVVMAKMRELLKEYEGQYMFIELDAYSVLLESLISDQENHQNQLQVETSNSKGIVQGAIVPAYGDFIDIPVCSSTTHTVPPPPPPALPPPPPPLPPPPPPRKQKPCHGWICDDDDDDDDENLRLLTIPSSLNGQISPPISPPAQPVAQPEKSCQPAETEVSSGRKNRPKRRSMWDLRPDD
ncbi:hypothetical protein R6Q59_014400 [Mikania micrantha]|uniref:WIYLD domain-containing protein n=1 Tax=Mikania micrantha TaxID=192012 RepID=A0A5N6PAP1_9ASTR|nr:hypothetical protein E3N88_13553 [Mikania micrantha]